MMSMIEDMKHLEDFAGLAREVMDMVAQYNARMSGLTDKAEMVSIRLEHIRDLTGLLQKQSRFLRYMAGEKVEPEVQFAEAIVTGLGGGGLQ